MNKLFKWLIIFLIVIINYKCGVVKEYNTNGIHKGNKYLILFFQYGGYRKIELDTIKSWEIQNAI